MDRSDSRKVSGEDDFGVLSRTERRRLNLDAMESGQSDSELSSIEYAEESNGGVDTSEAGLYDLDWSRVKSGIGGEGVVFTERVSPDDVDDFDVLSLPAPLLDPDAYGEEPISDPVEDDISPGEDHDEEGVDQLKNSSTLVEGGFVPWEVVFPEGEDPRLIVRAALISEGGDLSSDDEEVPLVESSVELSAEDVDRLLKYSHKVEKYHSRKSRFGRRLINWAMRHKFFAGMTFAIISFLGISEILRGLFH